MNLLKLYRDTICNNCTDNRYDQYNVLFWRNKLFASTIQVLLPLCMIAMLPSLLFIFSKELYILGWVDLSALLCMLGVGFFPGLTVITRKIIFITCVYLFSFLLLYFLGLKGRGLLYLLTACVFSLLIFSSAKFYWPAWINTIICGVYIFLGWKEQIPTLKNETATVTEMIVICSNLVFLSFLLVAMIPRLFDSLQSAIQKEIEWKRKLEKERKILDNTLTELKQKNEDLEQFSYIASHDLQEPLRMISNFLKLLEQKYQDGLDEKARKYIHFAVDGARRMNQIILDLLDYSRAGRITGKLEEVDMHLLINEVIQLFQKELANRKGSLTFEKLPTLTTHRNLVFRILQNLVGNALKYSRAEVSPSLHLSCSETASHWIFSLSDNGIGIEKEYFDDIFILFHRLHNREAYSGTGIGLSITKKMVEQLGGAIWVDSQINVGSTFFFSVLKQQIKYYS